MALAERERLAAQRGRRAVRAHDLLVTALYGGELTVRPDSRLLFNRWLSEPEWNHAGALDIDLGTWPEPLEAIRRFYAERGRPAAVVLDPFSLPQGLPALLAAARWSEAFRHAGLLFPEQLTPRAVAWPAGASIVEARSAEAMLDFVSVFESAFVETAPGYSFAGYRKALPAGLAQPAAGVEIVHLLVRIDGEPAAVGSRATVAGVAGLYNLGVAPRFRKLGLGAAITLHRVAEARQAGAQLIYLLTEDAGVEAAQLRRGFERGFELVGWVEPA